MLADLEHFTAVVHEASQLVPENLENTFVRFPLSTPVIPGSLYDSKLQMRLENAMLYQNSSGQPASHLKLELDDQPGIKTVCIETKLGGDASMTFKLMRDKSGDIILASILHTIEGSSLEARRATQGDILAYELCLKQLQNRPS